MVQVPERQGMSGGRCHCRCGKPLVTNCSLTFSFPWEDFSAQVLRSAKVWSNMFRDLQSSMLVGMSRTMPVIQDYRVGNNPFRRDFVQDCKSNYVSEIPAPVFSSPHPDPFYPQVDLVLKMTKELLQRRSIVNKANCSCFRTSLRMTSDSRTNSEDVAPIQAVLVTGKKGLKNVRCSALVRCFQWIIL